MNIFLTSPISFPGLGIEGIDPPDGFCIPGTNFEIKFYGVIIAIGVLLAVTYCLRRAKQFGVTQDDILNLVLICLPSAIVGARLYYVVFEWDQFFGPGIPWYRFLDIRSGGLAIYGGVIGAVLGMLIYTRVRKLKVLPFLDLTGIGLLLGQAIGRWGNFFNQEAFGELVTNPDLQFFPYAVYIERLGEWHMATFFYESAACFLIFIFLLIYRRKAKNAPAGNLFLWYWVLYGVERAYVEGLRTDSLWIFKGGIPIGNLIFFPNGLRVSQVLSIIMVIAFGTVLIVRAVKRHKKQTAEDETAPLDPSLQLVSEDGAAEAESADESAPAPEAEVSAPEQPESAGESAQPEEPAAKEDKDGEEAEENK